MILEKRENGLWWFYDEFYIGGFTPYPFGCIIDKSANTFVITKENRPSYPKEPLPVAEVQIRVLPSTSLETYTTAELLENRLLALGFPPLVVGTTPSAGIPEAPEDGNLYGRKDADWEIVSQEIDLTEHDLTELQNNDPNYFVRFDEINAIGTSIPANLASANITVASRNISDNVTKIQRGSYNTSGVLVNSNNTISLAKQSIVNLNPKIIFGHGGGLASTAPRVLFFNSSDALISYTTGNTTNPQTFTPPAGTVTFAVNLASGTNVGLTPATSPFINSFMMTDGNEVVPFEKYGFNLKPYPKEVYVSTTGSDTTGDGSINNPYLTVNNALSLYPFAEIVVRGGEYWGAGIFTNTNVSEMKIRNHKDENVVFSLGTRILSATLESGYTKVYKASTNIAKPTGTTHLWQHNIAETAVLAQANREWFHFDRTNELTSTLLTEVASLALLEASTSPSWFHDGTTFFFTIVSGSNLATNPIVIPSNTGNINRPSSIKGINFMYHTTAISNSVKFENCTFSFGFANGLSAVTGANLQTYNCGFIANKGDGVGYAGTAKGYEFGNYGYRNFDEDSSAHDNSNVTRKNCIYKSGFGVTDVGSSVTTIESCVISQAQFTYTLVGGKNLGNCTISNSTIIGGINSSVANRVRLYNTKVGGTKTGTFIEI